METPRWDHTPPRGLKPPSDHEMRPKGCSGKGDQEGIEKRVSKRVFDSYGVATPFTDNYSELRQCGFREV